MDEKSGKRQLLDGVVALPPSDTPGKADAAFGKDAFGTAALAADAASFEQAGWQFLPAGDAGDAAYKVYSGDDGRLAVIGNSFNVKFGAGVSPPEIEALLAENGLRKRRSLGFAKNLVMVEASGDAARDPYALADKLAAHPQVEFAEPVVVENIGKR